MHHNGNDVTGVSVDLCLKSKKPHSKCKGEYRVDKKKTKLAMDRQRAPSFLPQRRKYSAGFER